MYLKSNMDRFIVCNISTVCHPPIYLKSNMDRFIAQNLRLEEIVKADLKSNMDRFIVLKNYPNAPLDDEFKIQYG